MDVTTEVTCPDCGSPMVLRETKRFPTKDGRPKKFYGCEAFPACRAVHGAHQQNGEPLGIPGDSVTRTARMAAHAAFDRTWRCGWMTRKQAYRSMAIALRIEKDEAHIGRFGVEECRRVEGWAGGMMEEIEKWEAKKEAVR